MNFQDRYGTLDRLFHRIAFRLGTAQDVLADVEKMLFGDTLDGIPLVDPVFITALPRSGTTILLRLLCGTERFASHTYRDMPFVLSPMLWSRFSHFFAVDDASYERAHGDGLRVSADTPEAFEEMVWKRFWPEHYRRDRILPWRKEDRMPGFDGFLQRHMRKVIAVRREDPSDALRYVSKNNLNISRLGAVPGPFRGGTFVIPFREPVQQAASMLRQHRRFLELHDEDDFVREYMEAIGHHEFGRALRPVDFGGWLEEAPPPARLEFWLRYWIEAYRFVLDNADDSTVLVSYGRLTASSRRALARLAAAVGVPRSELVADAERLHPPRTHEVNRSAVPPELLERASELHECLRERASV